jgi:hypothetical protein
MFAVAAMPSLAAKVRVSGDNEWTVFVHGTKAAEGKDWQVPSVSEFKLVNGRATVAVFVHDAEPGAAGRGGALIDIVLDDGTYIGTADKAWKGEAGKPLAQRSDGWEKPEFNDSGWKPLTVLDKFGAGIWGFGAAKMREVLKNPDCTSNWAWVGPNDQADDIYFRYHVGGPPTAVDARGRLAALWAEMKSSR